MADSETTTINLQHKISVNGISYGPGQGVKVPKTQADDISRMDYDHQQYLNTLHTKRVFEVDAGTIPVGGGAE